jgi:hypothetical protein
MMGTKARVFAQVNCVTPDNLVPSDRPQRTGGFGHPDQRQSALTPEGQYSG